MTSGALRPLHPDRLRTMDNRFGFKDLVVSSLLIVLIIVVLLAMKQYDRQWDTMRRIQSAVEDQNRTLVTIAETLRRGVPTMGAAGDAGGASGAPPEDGFGRLRAARENEDFAYGDWFIDAFAQSVGKLTPLVPADAYQRQVEGFVLESLIVRDPETLEWKPWIARSWDVADDGLTITFELRDDVVFSDGTPLTSADVVFTYELINNPEINAPQLRSYYENFESVEADGPYRVVFRFREPYFLALSFAGGMSVLPEHFYARFTPEEFNTMPGLLFGSGPYRLNMNPEDWRPGTGRIELVRNDRYWGPRPSFDRIVWREIPDEVAQLTSFRNREVDRYGVRPEQYQLIQRDEDLQSRANMFEFESPTGGYRYLGWNQMRNGRPTPFADVRVRRAMTMLTNRDEMVRQLMVGLATVATGPFHPLGAQADPQIEPWPFDPQAAIALLREAGFEDRNGDGVLQGPDGRPFRFRLVYPAQNVNYQQMAFYLRDAYARAGIILEPDPTEWNTMLQRIDERDFDAITLAWTGGIEGDPKQIFHSDSIAAGGHNYISYRNSELDELIDRARVTVDEEERMAMWRQAHRIFHEDQPYTFLFFPKSVVLIDDRIRNVEVTRTGMNSVVEMYVPRDLQRWTGQ
jgi:peptide/nickel transport system substrate-binding protein